MAFHNDEAVLDIGDKPKFGQWVGLSIQHLFAMFGSTVLVPILVGLDPSIALFSSGVGTLVYILITRGKIPAYMGSSFSFITIMQALMKGAGYPAIAQGTVAVGVVYLIVALIRLSLGRLSWSSDCHWPALLQLTLRCERFPRPKACTICATSLLP